MAFLLLMPNFPQNFKSMNKRLLAVLIVSAFTFGVFRSISYSNRNFAPVAHTNAPGENSCARSGCHSSFSLVETLADRLQITANGSALDASFLYTPGETYTMTFTIANAKARNGFSLTILDEAGQMAGTLSTSSGDAQVSNGPGGKRYVGHTNSLGVSSWDFEWTAPSDSLELTVFSIANLSNNNLQTNGDSILTKSFSFTAVATEPQDTTGTNIFERVLAEDIQIISPLSNESVVFNIDVENARSFDFYIYDAMGQLIANQDYFLHSGKQQLNIPFEGAKGIYFLQAVSQGKTKTQRFIN